MSEFLTRMYSIDQNMFILIAMMCVWATLIMNKALDHALITVFSLPTFLHSALAVIVILEDQRIFLSFDKSLNLVMAASIGIILALIAMVVLFVVATSYIDARDKVAKNRAAAEKSMETKFHTRAV